MHLDTTIVRQCENWLQPIGAMVDSTPLQSQVRLPHGLKERLDSEGDESDDEMDFLSSLTDRDRDILSEEEEREKLLRDLPSRGELKRTDNRLRGVRKRKRQHHGEKKELMFEMEEGGFRDDPSSQSETSSLNLGTETQNKGAVFRVGAGV